MAIEQQADGRWKVDVEPIKGKRFRKTFKTKGEASRFEATCRARLIETPNWSPKPKDRRRLSELVTRYHDLHGHTLADAARLKQILLKLTKDLGDPIAVNFTGNAFCETRRIQLDNGVKGKTLNNRLGYLKAVFNELHRLGDIDYPNPLANVRPLRLQERPLSFLSVPQINEVLSALDARDTTPGIGLVARVCLATGARWGEAQALTPERVKNGAVTFANTKSRRTRSIPIDKALEKQLLDHFKQHGLFSNCMLTFSRVLETTSIKLPAGQATHVLRHTFASHFVMRGGNILVLQKILGHASLTMTMRYAHLAPDHLQDALTLNPLFDTGKGQKAKSPEILLEIRALAFRKWR
ncbi:phage integrase [Pseudomonas sp. UBA2684]|uniref:phage integrase n=1 Tax=Pseudomonas sp. UBA2684 TaxID=1947311 RepID=UPI0025E76635|nr:tyrosine-type recombinase/integrase [Pseudomonas sp. UBA2684]|tara:strand:+ start:19838 stop:20896 length:1059 start_codon:yes stop_codon:yes gene_type:complete